MYWNSGDYLNEVNKRGRKVLEGKEMCDERYVI